jgi:hypothetical protein
MFMLQFVLLLLCSVLVAVKRSCSIRTKARPFNNRTKKSFFWEHRADRVDGTVVTITKTQWPLHYYNSKAILDPILKCLIISVISFVISLSSSTHKFVVTPRNDPAL